MPSSRAPGPLCQSTELTDLHDGTSCRATSPTPQLVGFIDPESVARLSAGEKLIEAARRATPRLPLEMREQFAALFSAANIGITAGVLSLWGGSHLFGFGEIADVGLAIAGVAVLGVQAFAVGRDLGEFLDIAIRARSVADLERSADHLARAVVVIGATAFVAMILKGRGTAGTVAGRGLCGASMEWWVARLGRVTVTESQMKNLKTALEFFEELHPPPATGNAARLDAYRAHILSKLKGLDIKAPDGVTVVDLTELRNTTLVRYGSPAGDYFMPAGTPLNRAGIAEGAHRAMRTVGENSQVTPSIGYNRLRVRPGIGKGTKVLKARTTSMTDTFTEGRQPTFGSGRTVATGGGVQYIIPNALRVLEPVPRGPGAP